MSPFGGNSDLTSLVRKCQRQDARAWSEIVDRFSRLVYSIAHRHRLGQDDAEDVFQSTFQALYQTLDRIEDPESLPKWIAVTASRQSLRVIRIQKRHSADSLDGPTLEQIIASEDRDAEEEAVRACLAESVRGALSRAKGRCGPLLTMLYIDEDSTYQSISERLGIPIGAIGPTRARCLEKLRKELSDIGLFEGDVS